MFDLSIGEIGLIALVALLVLGPERLPKAARTVGFYVRKARQSWFSVRAEFERELAADELKSSLKLDEMHATLEQTAKDVRGELAQASAGFKAATGAVALQSSVGEDPALAELDDGLSAEERARQIEALPFEPEPEQEPDSERPDSLLERERHAEEAFEPALDADPQHFHQPPTMHGEPARPVGAEPAADTESAADTKPAAKNKPAAKTRSAAPVETLTAGAGAPAVDAKSADTGGPQR